MFGKRLFSFRRPTTAAVILAGGSGTRMGEGSVPKQLLPLCGEPLLVHTVRAFEACPHIDEVVVVSRREEMGDVAALLGKYPFRKLRAVVPGGETRQMSALCGFGAIGSGMRYVAIHDACRCLVTPEMISNVVLHARLYGAAAAGTPVTDTLKIVRPSGFVRETPDRSEYWQAQTPQVFESKLYRAAAETVRKSGFTLTDDAALAEWIGQRVYMVDCGRENVKITFPADLPIAEAILRRRAEQGKDGTEV